MNNNKIDYLQDSIGFVSLVDHMIIDSPLKVVNSARITYNKVKSEFDSKDSKLTSFLWDYEHTSPYRHSYFTFHIKLPLFVARQLTKYQVGSSFRSYEIDGVEVSFEVFDHLYDTDKGCSWNEVSGRYITTSNQFYIPRELRSNPGHGNKQTSGKYINPLVKDSDLDYLSESDLIKFLEESSLNSLKNYELLVKNGVAKELARLILPQNIYTECYWTCSLQAIIHFLHQRLKSDAQYEIRMLAEGIYSIMKPTLDKIGINKEDL